MAPDSPDSPDSLNAPTEPPIELIEASDRRAEVEAIARRIVTLCRRDEDPQAASTRACTPAVTWRDIAVLARDLTPYEPHLREVFRLFEIPFFLDRPRQMEGHPLARLLLSALVVLRSGWAGDAVLQHLKCGLAGLKDEDAIAQLENQIRAIDPHGSYWMEMLQQSQPLREAWQAAAKPLRRLEGALREGRHPARTLWNLLEEVEASATLDRWIATARQAGDEESVQLHEQAWEQTVVWLEEFEHLTATLPEFFDGELHARPFREQVQDLIDLVESALSSTRARLIPPTLNQVTIGSVDRSRTPEVKIAFIMGLNDGEFPKNWQPDAILGDEERDQLVKSGKRLGPDTSSKRIQEHFLAYIALTRPSRRLVLSRPQVDDEGRVCDPSPLFVTAARSFPLAPCRTVKRAGEQDDPALPLRPEEWALRLAMTLGRIEDLSQASALASVLATGVLLQHPRLSPAQRRGLELARKALETPDPATLAPELALAYWQDQPSLPVTALETYGECPFKFFAFRMLGLTERVESKLSGMDIGSIRHEVLDRLFSDLRTEAGLDWGTIDIEDTERRIDRCLEDLRKHSQWGPRLEASALGHLTLREIGSDLMLFVRALQLAGRRCAFMQVEAEWTFGREEELVIHADPLRFSIRGKIDRVDAVADHKAPGSARPHTCVLIDYKSGQRRLNLGRIMAGIDLQLLTYGLAYKQALERQGRGPVRVGGVFYWPLSAPLRDAQANEPADPPAVDEGWFDQRSPSGLFEEDLFALLDSQVGPDQGSPVFSFRLKKDGTVNNTGQSHWPSGKLDQLLEFERQLLGRLAGHIVGGEIKIRPFRQAKDTACDLCGYSAACRKADPQGISFRTLPPVKRADVLDMLNQAREELD